MFKVLILQRYYNLSDEQVEYQINDRMSFMRFLELTITEEQRASNKEKSRIRSRVEHIFGFMENSMNEMYIQCIGIRRATAVIGLMNLTYNMFRKIQLTNILRDNCALS